MHVFKQATLLFMVLVSSVFAFDADKYINDADCSQVIGKESLTICYDYNYKSAKAVSYTLSGDLVNALNIDKRPSFKSEKEVPRVYRAYNSDYRKTGYDKGHLACDAAFDWSQESLNETYSLANSIPQARRVNRYTWSKAERYARFVAVQLGEVNVINVVKYLEHPKRIGKHKVAVPEGFYKVLYNEEKNYERCLYYKNDNNVDTKSDHLKDHIVSCSDVSFIVKPTRSNRSRTCSSFNSWEEAQAWYENRNSGWKRMDRNKDGVACESLL